MFMRISSGALLLALAACSGSDATPERATRAEGSSGEDNIACALAGSQAFAPVCAVEQGQGEEGAILTLLHPDGGFRRLLIAQDGRGVVSADGIDLATVTPVADALIEVAVGGDRYRLPATVKR